MSLLSFSPHTNILLNTAKIGVDLCCFKTKTSRVVWEIAILGVSFLLGGALAVASGQSFAFSFPLLIAGAVFLVLSAIILIALKWPRSISSPEFLELTLPGVSSRLRSAFALDQVFPLSNKINNDAAYVLIRSKKTDLQLCFYKGHPLNDPLLKKKESAILLCTNSDRKYNDVIHRSLAVIGRIEKDCWNAIVKPDSMKFPPGSIAHGPWVNKSKETAPVSHLIFINPPTIETLIHTRKPHYKTVTFQDFNHKKAFKNIVNAYLKCFRACRENHITSLQLEFLGLNDIGSHQEEYEIWYSLCSLALLEAIHIEEQNEDKTLKQITVNHQKEFPLLSVLQKAYNEKM
ncbi:hypothetical protein [Chlamydia felis Fe/C-56]|uniref:Uncharacterized protein n=1 Tax=Chlamydia felis (strain Fe/C-56) TaxID=264202 RepID=Q253T8_CHLFF|nr:membrane protein [Chlamydia felis]BAE81450.1 hypothetical protein [Chlamydia felis Fe/C-56]